MLACAVNSFADDGDKLANKLTSVSIPAGRGIAMQAAINNIGHAKGTVAVDVVMDRKGNVLVAIANPKRSTVRDKVIISKLEAAVLAMKFDKNKKAPAKQAGTLTYTFK
ncbi:hypothetical protein [Mucilaginibacter antarcticus]